MEAQPFKNGLIDLEEYEIVPEPIPESETPRQCLLRMTGHDFPDLETATWEYVREYPPMAKWFTDCIMRFYRPPRIMLRKRNYTRMRQYEKQ